MAQRITLTSGSIFNGNPITFDVTPTIVKASLLGNENATVAMHRIIVDVECGMSGGNYEILSMSAPVDAEDGTPITIDISSALRTFRDSYEYTPDPITYPLVKFNVFAYDEYLLDGEAYKTDPISYLPSGQHLSTIFGGYSDMIRLTATPFKEVTTLSTKPTSTPHLATVGEVVAYAPPYTTPQVLQNSESLAQPQSKNATISKEGAQTIGYQSVYALPAAEASKRQIFRFINRYGVLESISVPKAYSKKRSVTSNVYDVVRPENFNSFSRALVRKLNNREAWLFTTDPLTEEWLQWYLHEFLMSEHVWLFSALAPRASAQWLPVTITPEDDATFIDYSKNDHLQIAFTAQLSINS